MCVYMAGRLGSLEAEPEICVLQGTEECSTVSAEGRAGQDR